MTIRTGALSLAGLRDGRTIWREAERIAGGYRGDSVSRER